jgi:hypothetical protein
MKVSSRSRRKPGIDAFRRALFSHAVRSMRCQKFATVFSPNTNAFEFVLVPPGSITYWMFGRTCRPASGR